MAYHRCVFCNKEVKMENQYYIKPALAMIKGNFARNGIESPLLDKNIDDLTENEIESIFAKAREQELKLYHFKRSDRPLPRISKISNTM